MHVIGPRQGNQDVCYSIYKLHIDEIIRYSEEFTVNHLRCQLLKCHNRSASPKDKLLSKHRVILIA